MDFNTHKNQYRSVIEQKIAFAGKGLDFYTRVKADYLRKIVDRHLPDTHPVRILDVGCGHGYIHPMLRALGYEVTGVEVASEVLAMAQQENPGNKYVAYDGSQLPFEDKSFDLVLAICVMHHVPPKSWPNFVSEARRVLRPNGQFVVFEHNPLNPATRYVVANNDIDSDAVLLRHTRLATMLKDAGLQAVYTRSILFTPFDQTIFRLMDEVLGRLPLGAQYYATATAP